MVKILTPIIRALEQWAPMLALALRARLQKLGTGEQELGLLVHLVDPDRHSVDVGANKGVYTYWLERLSLGATSVEPHPECAEYLRRALGKRINLIEGACSNREGTVMLRVPVSEGRPNLYRASIESANDLNGTQTRDHAVRTYELDNLGLDDPGFIKVDVEGHEMAVLQGAQKVLKKHKPVLLLELEERHKSGTIADASDFLKSYGYSGYYLANGKLRDIRQFDVRQHQGKEAERSTGNSPYRYINNFIFVNKDSSQVMENISHLF